MSIDIGLLAEELKRDELDGQDGSGVGYKCPADKWTIGFGHNIEDNPISARAAEMILQDDIGQVLAQCERFAWFYLLNSVRKRVIVNMVFNMGANGVAEFENMIAAIHRNDWNDAANEMKDSNWYNQTGDRARRLVYLMKEG